MAIFILLLAFVMVFNAWAQFQSPGIMVNATVTLDSLMHDEDTDGDKKITIDDPHVLQSTRGDKRFWIRSLEGKRYEVSGTYFLSNLLQELRVADLAGIDTFQVDPHRIFEPPADRTSRLIKTYYWDGLTRRVDEQGLLKIISDEKTKTIDGFNYIYVPPADRAAYDYFSSVATRHSSRKLRVVQLPRNITAQYVRQLDGRHGILSLALEQESGGGCRGVPFVVPGGRFNEMYGWDSYFIVLGLLRDGRINLAKAMVDNFLYQITHFGKILNANRTYFLTRSQPPFLTSMARAVYAQLPTNDEAKQWLKNVLMACIKEYREVWMNSSHLTNIGLCRYRDSGVGPPPEVEPGHFDIVYGTYAKKYRMDARLLEKDYKAGKFMAADLDAYFEHDRAMRESGHDTSYRLENVCAHLVTVDLNSLLYKVETDIAEMIEQEFSRSVQLLDGTMEKSASWFEQANNRKELVTKYLWNKERGMFFDYDFVRKRQNFYVSATTLYPLWSGLATKEQAGLLVKNTLPLLEMPGGIVSSTEESRGPLSAERPPRQWDYPNGWAPHQMLTWRGLMNYGYDSIAVRLMYRWLFTITVNAANYSGTIPEKFDVARRSHQVFAEYGNVGTTFAYITQEGFGWTNASYQEGLALLPEDFRGHLNRLVPPEWIFE